MLDEYREKLANDKELYISVKVMPSAGRSDILEKMADESLKVALKASPEKGKANLELIKLLAKEFDVKRDDVKIINGQTSRHKLIKISI